MQWLHRSAFVVACLMMVVGIIFPADASAITLKTFRTVAASGDDDALTRAAFQVIDTGSPEFMVRAEREISALYDDNANMPHLRKRIVVQLLNSAANSPIHSFETQKWVSRAQYDLGKFYLSIGIRESEALELFRQATKHGHRRAPARLANLIKAEQPEEALALLRLSLALGNQTAEQDIAILEREERLKRLGIDRE